MMSDPAPRATLPPPPRPGSIRWGGSWADEPGTRESLARKIQSDFGGKPPIPAEELADRVIQRQRDVEGPFGPPNLPEPDVEQNLKDETYKLQRAEHRRRMEEINSSFRSSPSRTEEHHLAATPEEREAAAKTSRIQVDRFFKALESDMNIPEAEMNRLRREFEKKGVPSGEGLSELYETLRFKYGKRPRP